MAVGSEPSGVSGLKPAANVHWSAKSGSGSAYTTASDEARFMHQLFQGKLISSAAQRALLEVDPRTGYGWVRSVDARFGEDAYHIDGRAPGFASFVMWLPKEKLTVVVLSNVYASSTSNIGFDLAAIALELPFVPFRLAQGDTCAQPCEGTFRFGVDFYQPNANLQLTRDGKDHFLRWPSGESTPLIPVGHDQFIDRAYWEDIENRTERRGQARETNLRALRGERTERLRIRILYAFNAFRSFISVNSLSIWSSFSKTASRCSMSSPATTSTPPG